MLEQETRVGNVECPPLFFTKWKRVRVASPDFRTFRKSEPGSQMTTLVDLRSRAFYTNNFSIGANTRGDLVRKQTKSAPDVEDMIARPRIHSGQRLCIDETVEPRQASLLVRIGAVDVSVGCVCHSDLNIERIT